MLNALKLEELQSICSDFDIRNLFYERLTIIGRLPWSSELFPLRAYFKVSRGARHVRAAKRADLFEILIELGNPFASSPC